MKKIEIKNLDKDVLAEGLLLVKSIEAKTAAKSNKTYYQITLTDGSTDLPGSYFNDLPDYKSFQGKVVNLALKTQVYNNKFCCVINSLSNGENIPDELKDSFLRFSSSRDIYQQYQKDLIDLINTIQDKEIKKLCQYVFTQKYAREFQTYPAAKTFHHNGYGGLLEHSVNLAKVALACANIYSYDLEFDKDLIIAGAFFQDIGKIFEFDLDDMYNVTYSKVGILKGHITIGNEILHEALHELNIDSKQDKFCRLSHIILTHHGLLEYGSPTLPSIPEAILIARVDHLDANIKASIMAIKNLMNGEDFSTRIAALENVQILRPGSTIYIKDEITSSDEVTEEDLGNLF